MSFGKPPAQQLRARTVEQGIEDYRSDEVIRFLNQRLPYGLAGTTEGLPLPNDLDMARAALQQSVTPLCYERHGANIDPASRLISPACDVFSYFLHSEEEGWYRATPDSDIFQAAA
jgi:hypothetical protein